MTNNYDWINTCKTKMKTNDCYKFLTTQFSLCQLIYVRDAPLPLRISNKEVKNGENLLALSSLVWYL